MCLLLTAAASMRPAATRPVQDATVLEPDTVVLGETSGDRSRRYRLVATAGTFLRINIRKETEFLRLALFAPDGTRVREAVADDGRFSRPLSYVTETPGSYELDVRLFNAAVATSVTYELALEQPCPATVQHRDRVNAEKMVDEAREVINSAADSSSMRSAIATLQQARAIYKSAGDTAGEASTLRDAANAFAFELGEYQPATDLMKQQADLYRVLGDQPAEAEAIKHASYIARRGGDYQAMLDLADEAMPIYRAIGNPIEGLMTFGNAFALLNDPVHAAEAFEQADALSKTNRTGTLLQLAARQRDHAGQKEKALEDYEAAARAFRSAGHAGAEIDALNRAAGLYAELGQLQKALHYLAQVLNFWQAQQQKPGGDALRVVGTTYSRLGERQKAVEYLDKAFAVTPRIGHPNMLVMGGLGEAYGDIGENAKALSCFDEAIAMARNEHNPHDEAKWLARKAFVERDLGELVAARSHIEQALVSFETLRGTIAGPGIRSGFYASTQRFYELYVDLLMQLHQVDRQGGHAAAARGLLEVLAEAGIDIRRGVDPALLERERSLQKQIDVLGNRRQELLLSKSTLQQHAELSKQIDLRTTDYEQVQGQIRRTSPHYATLTKPQPLGVRDIQQRVLDADTLLLEYELGDAHSYLWVVSRDSLVSFTLPPRTEVEDAARRVYELVTARNRHLPGEGAQSRQARLDRARAEMPGRSARLSQMILGPAASLLGTKRLLIVAQGALQYISFAALPDPASGSKLTASSPLIATHEVVHAPSASVLDMLREETSTRPSAPRAVAVLADPVFDSHDPRVHRNGTVASSARNTSTPDSAKALERSLLDVDVASSGVLARLPFTRREANAITGGLSPQQALQATDFRASMETATSPDLAQYRIVHFATHALINSETPALSGLVLSLVDERGASRDGFLRLHEIYNLTLPADLVVMSACQTALGKDIRGEGLVGLTRGFMYAGAARVAASLWRVDDAATAELMSRFYRNMLGENLRPAAALRAAQMEMRRQNRWQDPYYWAAFQLQGEWK